MKRITLSSVTASEIVFNNESALFTAKNSVASLPLKRGEFIQASEACERVGLSTEQARVFCSRYSALSCGADGVTRALLHEGV